MGVLPDSVGKPPESGRKRQIRAGSSKQHPLRGPRRPRSKVLRSIALRRIRGTSPTFLWIYQSLGQGLRVGGVVRLGRAQLLRSRRQRFGRGFGAVAKEGRGFLRGSSPIRRVCGGGPLSSLLRGSRHAVGNRPAARTPAIAVRLTATSIPIIREGTSPGIGHCGECPRAPTRRAELAKR